MPAERALRVFITGASSGIGEALAKHYAGHGAILGLVSRRRDALERIAALIRVPTSLYAVDVRDGESLAAAATDFMARHGSPDIVIANAGVSHGTLTEHAVDACAFQEIIDINLVGMMKTFQPFIAPMRASGRGTLAGIASVAGIRGLPGAGAYSASKSAAISYLESLRVELYGSGVAVVTVCPGYIATPMTAGNPYPMPFILSAEAAAGKIARAVASRSSYAVIPWQMALVAKLLRLLPNALYDRLFAQAPHKPRRVI